MILRPYQSEASTKAADYFQSKSKKRPLVVAPTAAGKSLIIADIVKKLDCPMIVLQPSKELLAQNIQKYRDMGGIASVYSASFNTKEVGRVTYATILSIANIPQRFKGYGMIIDESHLFPPNFDSVFRTFTESAGISKSLGLTATPFRLKSNSLGGRLNFLTRMRPGYFNEVLHVTQVKEMVEGGFWSKLLYGQEPFDGRSLRFNSTGSDYDEKSMTAALERSGTLRKVAGRTMDALESGRKAILIFVPTVASGHALAKQIHGSVVIHGKMTPAERDSAVRSFRAGRTKVAINVNVLSVGFDFPGIDAIMVARPTLSLAWYYQALGRGTRIDPTGEKKECVIMDFVDNFKKFGRIEQLQICDVDGYGWGVFGGNNERLFTNIPMNDSAYAGITKDNCSKVKEITAKMYAPTGIDNEFLNSLTT